MPAMLLPIRAQSIAPMGRSYSALPEHRAHGALHARCLSRSNMKPQGGPWPPAL